MYACTGTPSPALMKQICGWLMTEPLLKAASKVANVQVDQGLCLSDLVVELGELITEISMPVSVKIQLTIELGELENRLSKSMSEGAERVQRYALASAFLLARDQIVGEQ